MLLLLLVIEGGVTLFAFLELGPWVASGVGGYAIARYMDCCGLAFYNVRAMVDGDKIVEGWVFVERGRRRRHRLY